jgi:bifunctional non-homologous end joining protein LigD
VPLGFIPQQLCVRADKPPTGTGWVHEIKFDGYRMLAIKDTEGVGS